MKPYQHFVPWSLTLSVWLGLALNTYVVSDHGTRLEFLARGQRQGEIRTSLPLRGHGQHTAKGIRNARFRRDPKGLLTQLPLRGKDAEASAPSSDQSQDISDRPKSTHWHFRTCFQRFQSPHRQGGDDTAQCQSRQNTPSALFFCRLGCGHQTPRPKRSGKKAEARSIWQFTLTRDLFP